MKKNKYSLILVLLILFGFSPISTASAQTLEQFQVLVYTSPDRWHDPTIPTAIAQLRELARKHTFGLTWAQEAGRGSVSNPLSDEFLENIDVIVFLHSRGNDLTDEQTQNFKEFIRNGGGFVGIHAVSANSDQEEWFQRLVGRVFTDHPEVQTAVMNVQDKNFPATMHLPDKWVWTDEWYSFGESLTDNLNTLITVDESTYDPNRTWGDDTRFTEMGKFHPISWYQEFEGGRSFYTTLGHLPTSYKEPWFLKHIYGGIYWAATGLGISKVE